MDQGLDLETSLLEPSQVYFFRFKQNVTFFVQELAAVLEKKKMWVEAGARFKVYRFYPVKNQ